MEPKTPSTVESKVIVGKKLFAKYNKMRKTAFERMDDETIINHLGEDEILEYQGVAAAIANL